MKFPKTIQHGLHNIQQQLNETRMYRIVPIYRRLENGRYKRLNPISDRLMAKAKLYMNPADYAALKEWNENNSPLFLFPFAEQALKAEKWAFVSDVIRLYALHTEGGIYMDTDVELIKPLDDFLHHPAFIGYERDSNMLQTAIFGAEKNNQWIVNWLKIYQNKEFNADRRIMVSLVNNKLISFWMLENGYSLDGYYKNNKDVAIYPKDYFCPMSYGSHFINKTTNTVCIHYYTFSWSEPETLKGHIKK